MHANIKSLDLIYLFNDQHGFILLRPNLNVR